MEFTRGRPSPAIVLAVIALVFAMAGSAVAGTDALSNKITKSKVKKIAKKQINKAAPGLDVKSAKTADKATNADNATNAANAANATNATNAAAVNNVAVNRFFAQVPPNTADANIATFGPITLKGSCDAAGNPTLRASFSKDVNDLVFDGSTASQFGNANIAAGTTSNISATPNFGSVGTAGAVASDKSFSVQVDYFMRDSPALGDAQCFYSGFVNVG